MNQRFYTLSSVALVALCFLNVAITVIEAKCNSCGSNGIACINETSFHMCYNDIADTTQSFPCPENHICSRSSRRCVERGMGMEPDCNINKGCGICDGQKMFACTSRTTFVQCHGDQLTRNIGVCPEGLTCDTASPEICVNDCHLPAELECERETFVEI